LAPFFRPIFPAPVRLFTGIGGETLRRSLIPGALVLALAAVYIWQGIHQTPTDQIGISVPQKIVKTIRIGPDGTPPTGEGTFLLPAESEWLTPDIGKKLGLTAAEVIRIQSSTGFVSCDGVEGSAALVFDNSHIITALHVLIDKSNPNEFRKNCVFFPHSTSKPYAPYSLILEEYSYIAGTEDFRNYQTADWIIVTLARPVTSGVPFAMDDEHLLKSGSTMIAISSMVPYRPHPRHPDNPGLPLAQKCEVHDVRYELGSLRALSHCNLGPGSSGGATIVRVGGDLVLVGVFVAGTKTPSLSPYGLTLAAAVGVTRDDVLRAIVSLEARKIRASAHDRHALLAGDIGDELDENTRQLAFDTEIDALNGHKSLSWTSNGIRGRVFLLPDRPLTVDKHCRTFAHAIYYGPNRMMAAKGLACRGREGRWQITFPKYSEFPRQ
jgi:surface antigen